MSDKKECACKGKIAALEAKVSELTNMMEIVEKKARIDGHVSDALFNVVRRFRLYRRDNK